MARLTSQHEVSTHAITPDGRMLEAGCVRAQRGVGLGEREGGNTKHLCARKGLTS